MCNPNTLPSARAGELEGDGIGAQGTTVVTLLLLSTEELRDSPMRHLLCDLKEGTPAFREVSTLSEVSGSRTVVTVQVLKRKTKSGQRVPVLIEKKNKKSVGKQ